jgi:hypothetical protein
MDKRLSYHSHNSKYQAYQQNNLFNNPLHNIMSYSTDKKFPSEPPRDPPHWSCPGKATSSCEIPYNPASTSSSYPRKKPRLNIREQRPRLCLWPPEWHSGSMPQSNVHALAREPEIELAPHQVLLATLAFSLDKYERHVPVSTLQLSSALIRYELIHMKRLQANQRPRRSPVDSK